MNWNNLFATASVMAFFAPVAIIIYNRYYRHRSLAALMVYYIVTGSYNLFSEQLFHVPASFLNLFATIDNYLDAPLMMLSLLFFCPNRQKQQKVYILTGLFICYEIVITCIKGFNSTSIVYILGPGLVLILGYTGYLFSRQIKFTIMHGKNGGRTIMLASILFAYSVYAFIYCIYYVQRTLYVSDTFLIYFLASTVSSVFMSIGLVMANKRLKKLNDLRITRKELQLFFNS